MNEIIVTHIVVIGKEARISYSVSPDLSKYFSGDGVFKMIYNFDLATVPHSILVVPFVCNVLPIVWLTDATLKLNSLDEDFYQSIEAIREGYQSVHPNLKFYSGHIIPQKVEKNDVMGDKSLCFFSGGVDAFATLFNHINEKPILFPIWGADIHFDDAEDWMEVYDQVKETAETFSLPYSFCRTNFRDCVNEIVLCEFVRELGSKDDWWHGFQHGIGLIGHAAPICFKLGIRCVYIASSYTIRERSLVTCASDPRIDNMVRFCGVNVCHDLFECNRQQKIHKIVDFTRATNTKIKLRVCWHNFSATNCCKCEKCYRTICGLIVAGVNPKDYGFPLTLIDFIRMIYRVKYKWSFSHLLRSFWMEIQDDLKSNNRKLVYPMNWLLNKHF